MLAEWIVPLDSGVTRAMWQRSWAILSLLLLVFSGIAAPARAQDSGYWLSRPDDTAASVSRITAQPRPGYLVYGFRVDVRRAVTPFYMIQLTSPIPTAVEVGDKLRVRFWARSLSTEGHPARVSLEDSQPPFQAIADDTPTFGREWKRYEILGTSRRAFPAKATSIHFQLGRQAGIVELAEISIMNMGIDPEVEKARKALAPDAVASRIRKYRMSDLQIQVIDSQGHPVSSAKVSVDQVRHEFLFGCDIFGLDLHDAANPIQMQYRKRFADLFNYATLPFYWGAFEPQPGKPEFDRLLGMAAWCQEHGIACKGHPLVWHQVYPSWAPKDDSVLPTLKRRVEDIVQRSGTRIQYFDVFNEIHDAPSTDTGVGFWVKKIGAPNALATALDWARKADPKTSHTFLYNDYRTTSATVDLLSALQKMGSLPDAIGIQSHMHGGNWPMDDVWTTIERFTQFKRPIHFTETTVLSGPKRNDVDQDHPPADWLTTPEMERVQADYVEQFYTTLFSHPAVHAITWWDLSDLNAWQGAPAGLIRKDMSPKPAYDRLMDLVHNRWWTKATGSTDAKGLFHSRVFRGIQRVSISLKDGRKVTRNVTVAGDAGTKMLVRI